MQRPGIPSPFATRENGLIGAGLEKAGLALESARSLIGQLPPEPPTLRGRVGTFFVKIVRRALFWYTPPIARFQAMVTLYLRELLAATKSVADNGQQSSEELDVLTRRLAELKSGNGRPREDTRSAARRNPDHGRDQGQTHRRVSIGLGRTRTAEPGTWYRSKRLVKNWQAGLMRNALCGRVWNKRSQRRSQPVRALARDTFAETRRP